MFNLSIIFKLQIKVKLIHLPSLYSSTCPHNALESHLKLIPGFLICFLGKKNTERTYSLAWIKTNGKGNFLTNLCFKTMTLFKVPAPPFSIKERQNSGEMTKGFYLLYYSLLQNKWYSRRNKNFYDESSIWRRNKCI